MPFTEAGRERKRQKFEKELAAKMARSAGGPLYKIEEPTASSVMGALTKLEERVEDLEYFVNKIENERDRCGHG